MLTLSLSQCKKLFNKMHLRSRHLLRSLWCNLKFSLRHLFRSK